MKATPFLSLIVVILFGSAGTTSAQPYATAAAGVSRNDIECSTLPTCEKTDVAFKLLGGYRVAPWLAAEAVYLEFGEGRTSGRTVEDTLRTFAFGGGVAFHGNVGSWTVTARVGAAMAAAKRTVTLVQTITNSRTHSSLAPYGGVGIGYRLSDNVALEFGFDVMRSKWERESDGRGWTWLVTAATAGVTIGR